MASGKELLTSDATVKLRVSKPYKQYETVPEDKFYSKNDSLTLGETYVVAYETKPVDASQVWGGQKATYDGVDYLVGESFVATATPKFTGSAKARVIEGSAVNSYNPTYSFNTDNIVAVTGDSVVAQEAFGKEMSILTTLINVALKQGDKVKSEKYINQALELDPENKELYYILGTSYIELKENEKAELNLLKAIEIDSMYVNAHSNLAALYMSWSLQLADEAKDLDYRDPRVNELENEKTELLIKAIPSLEIMAVEFPDNKSVIRNLAQAYRASGNEEKFNEWYNKLKN